jgi:hypothetical protein
MKGKEFCPNIWLCISDESPEMSYALRYSRFVNIGFDVLTLVTMMSTIFWVVMPSSLEQAEVLEVHITIIFRVEG